GSDQQAPEDASRDVRHDEDDGWRQAWPACRSRPGHGHRLRDAVAGTAGGDGEELARRAIAAWHARSATGHAEPAPEHARPARPGRRVCRIAGPAARKEEVTND